MSLPREIAPAVKIHAAKGSHPKDRISFSLLAPHQASLLRLGRLSHRQPRHRLRRRQPLPVKAQVLCRKSNSVLVVNSKGGFAPRQTDRRLPSAFVDAFQRTILTLL